MTEYTPKQFDEKKQRMEDFVDLQKVNVKRAQKILDDAQAEYREFLGRVGRGEDTIKVES